MEFRAEMRYLRVSPQKARLVLNLIKGRRVEEARDTLAFTKYDPLAFDKIEIRIHLPYIRVACRLEHD